MEKAVVELNKQNQKAPSEIPDSNLSSLDNAKGFNEGELEDLKKLRMLRNKLLHGYNLLSKDEMKTSISRLKQITSNTIAKIKDEKIREKLTKGIESL